MNNSLHHMIMADHMLFQKDLVLIIPRLLRAV